VCPLEIEDCDGSEMAVKISFVAVRLERVGKVE
jgi:hypothetical protein